ncbi:MAG TPA: SsrA-binding protein SmpB [Candidatus Sulfotelmatobacter sp.]|nr:SsrA-binding protein SmpB [Candidatus Sulfotelmatobacter sp.]
MAKKKSNQSKKIVNRRARFDYELGDSLVVGIELTGPETKSLRMGHGHLRGAYVTVKDNELYLLNATITGSSGVPINEEAKTRSRKLLAKRKEINNLILAKRNGTTIVPIELLTKGKYIKLKIAIGKGKKKYDKRQTIKQREASRQTRSLNKQYS